MKITIKCRWNNKILFEGEYESTKAAVVDAVSKRADLRRADLRGAYLQGADLQGADLQGADLRWADLQGADLRGEKLEIAPLMMQLDRWDVIITSEYLAIGCQRHTHDAWAKFKRTDISPMADGAWDWWKLHKDMLLAACAIHKTLSDKVEPEESEAV